MTTKRKKSGHHVDNNENILILILFPSVGRWMIRLFQEQDPVVIDSCHAMHVRCGLIFEMLHLRVDLGELL